MPDGDLPPCPLPGDKLPESRVEASKPRAIAAMHEFGVLVEACRASGMGRWQLQRVAKADPEFHRALQSARKECFERLEREMIRRGQFKGGDLAGIFTLKHNVGKYREITRLELTGKDGAPFNALESAKAEILTRLAKLAEESQGSRQGLEGKQEIVVGSRRPQLVKGAGETEVKRSSPRRGKD